VETAAEVGEGVEVGAKVTAAEVEGDGGDDSGYGEGASAGGRGMVVTDGARGGEGERGRCTGVSSIWPGSRCSVYTQRKKRR
jgi:hypothetical protein